MMATQALVSSPQTREPGVLPKSTTKRGLPIFQFQALKRGNRGSYFGKADVTPTRHVCFKPSNEGTGGLTHRRRFESTCLLVSSPQTREPGVLQSNNLGCIDYSNFVSSPQTREPGVLRNGSIAWVVGNGIVSSPQTREPGVLRKPHLNSGYPV